MYLNTIAADEGSRKTARRVGRGIGSGLGKTCGRGHKGQHSRSGGYHKVGFEGGQMPLQRRLPKRGFTSRRQAFNAEVRLSQLNALAGDTITLATLIAHGVVASHVQKAKIILAGELNQAVTVQGLAATAGAKAAIEAAGGSVEA